MRRELAKTIKIYSKGYDRYDCCGWKRMLLWFIEDSLLHWDPDQVAITVITDFVKQKRAELDALEMLDPLEVK